MSGSAAKYEMLDWVLSARLKFENEAEADFVTDCIQSVSRRMRDRGYSFEDANFALTSGEVFVEWAEKQMRDAPQVQTACRRGCALCCIFVEQMMVLPFEAMRATPALQKMHGKPDGRKLGVRACAALDPETNECRIYEFRPITCRAFLSRDFEACKKSSEKLGYVAAPSVANAISTHAIQKFELLYSKVISTLVGKGVLNSAAHGFPKGQADFFQYASGVIDGKDWETALKDALQQDPTRAQARSTSSHSVGD